jgi:hypothetical protein
VALAQLVCARARFETRAQTLEQIRLVSTLCAPADAAATEMARPRHEIGSAEPLADLRAQRAHDRYKLR